MQKYDFSQLNPIEFEELVNDLLEKEYNVKIERFKEGGDQGIDGRFEYDNGKKAIIQTKHYLKSGYNKLIGDLEKKVKIIDGVKKESGELVKVERLKKSGKLNKYIFTTSLGLSPLNKKEILKIFEGFIEKESDIFGQDELNSILSKNRDIENKYNKLWITSTNVLKSILNNIINNDIIGRSDDEIKKYVDKNRFFYTTKDFNNAIDILNKNGVLIVTGEPGIGKSTLSEQLCLRFVSKGDFKFFKISININEAEKIWKDKEKQIFYFDDFLGSNYLEKIDGKDSEIKNFIDRIIRAKKNENIEDKIFILNSRTTILKSGIENSAINGFKEEIKENEYILEVNNLSEEEKAYILYNHIYYSDLEENYIEKIYENKNYNKIIKHPNYNPRLIQFITNKKRVNTNETKYIDFIINNLDNPSEIWKNVFEKQSNDYINYLIYLTVFNGGKILEDILKQKYNIFAKKRNNYSITNYNFENVIKIALENFLVRINTNGIFTYSLINPSITDYILHKYINNEYLLIDTFDDLGTYEGLKQFNNLYKNGTNNNTFTKDTIKINTNKYYEILYGLYEKGLENKNNDYVIYLFNLGYKEKFFNTIINLIQKFINKYIDINNKNISILFELINQNYEKLNITNSKFLIKYIEKIDLDEMDIENIGEILNYIYNKENFQGYDEFLLDLLKEKLEKYLENKMQDEFEQIDFNDYMEDYENALDFDLDNLISEKISNIEINLDDLTKYYFISYMEKINIENIYDGLSINLEEQYEVYKNSFNYNEDSEYDKYKEMKEYEMFNKNDFNEIDYIFSK